MKVFVHIENCRHFWSTWKTLKDLFELQLEAKRSNHQLKLLQPKLTDGGDVMEYILGLKYIR